MNVKKYLGLIFASLAMFVVLTTCKKATVALGGQVDVLPPRSVVDSAGGGGSVNDTVAIRGSFTIRGTAEDDGGIASVVVVFKNRETGASLPAMTAALANPGSYKTDWSLEVKNDWTGSYVDEYKLVKQYPIPDGPYDVAITITDKNGKSYTDNKFYTIDNTPPVLIVEKPETFGDSTNWTTSNTTLFGGVLRIVGQAQDASALQELNFTAYNSSNLSADPVTITKKLSGSITFATELARYPEYEYKNFLPLEGWDVNAGLDGHSTHNILADFKAKDTSVLNWKPSANESEFYFSRDNISNLYDGKENGFNDNYDAKTIYNFLSNRKPWDDGNEESVKLKNFLADTKAQKFLADNKIPCGIGQSKKITFRLDPNKDPGYYISELELSDVSSTIPERLMGQAITIQLCRNNDGHALFGNTGNAKDDFGKSGLKVYLVKVPASGDVSELIENMKKGSASNGVDFGTSEVRPIYNIDGVLSDPKSLPVNRGGNYSIGVQLPTWIPTTYGLVLVGKDTRGNEFDYRKKDGSRAESGDKRLLLSLASSGNRPIIRANPLEKYFKKDSAFSYEFEVENGDPSKVKYQISGNSGVNEALAKNSSGTKYTLDLSSGDWDKINQNDGEYKVTISAANDSGSAAAQYVYFYIDNTAPTVQLQKPGTSFDEFGQYVNEFVVGASDTGSGLAKVVYQFEGDAKEYPFAESGGSYVASISVQSGKKLSIYAYDRVGNKSDVIEKTYIVDTQSPDVKITDISGALTDVNKNIVYVKKDALGSLNIATQATAKLAGASISKIEIALDEYNGTISKDKYSALNPANGATTGIFNISESNFQEGKIKVTVRAEDSSTPPNVGIINKFLAIDTTAPDFSITTGQTTFTNNVEFKVRIVENETSLDRETLKFKLFKKDNAGAWQDMTPSNNDVKEASADWTIKLDSLADEGEYKWTVAISDKAGNITTKEHLFAVDKNPPELDVGFCPVVTGTTKPDISKKSRDVQVYANKAFYLLGEAKDSNKLSSLTIKRTDSKGNASIVQDNKNLEGDTSVYFFEETPVSGKSFYEIAATDVAGKQAVKSLTVIYDADAPEVTISSVKQNNKDISADGYVTSGVLNVSGPLSDKGTDIKTIEYSFDGSTWAPLSHSDGSFKGDISVDVAKLQTSGKLFVKASDRAGNETLIDYALKLDVTPPTISDVKVNDNSILSASINKNSSNKIKVEIIAEDTESGVAAYEYKVSGSPDGFKPFTGSEIPDEINEDCVFEVRVVDNVGLTSEIKRITVSHDTTPPEVKFANGLDGATVNKTITISGTATDAKGLEKLELKIGGSLVKTFNGTAGYSWSYDLDTTTYPDDADLVLEAIATDLAGNTGPETITLKVNQNSDRPQLVVSNLVQLSDGFLTEEVLRGYVTDDDGIKEVWLSQDGNSWKGPAVLKGQNWEFDCKGPSGGDGPKTVYFKIIDNAGGEFICSANDVLVQPRIYTGEIKKDNGSGEKIEFTLDTTAPVIDDVTADRGKTGNFVSLNSNKIFKGESVSFTIKASDKAGIKQVDLKLGQDILGLSTSVEGDAGETQTLSIETNFTDKHGTHTLMVVVTDKSGKTAERSFNIKIDEKAPDAKITSPDEHTPVAGSSVKIMGSIMDDNEATSGVVSTSTKWLILNKGNAPKVDDSGWKEMNISSTPASFSFEADLDAILSESKTSEKLPDSWKDAHHTGCYNVPVYILTEDLAGNKYVSTAGVVHYDTEGRKPKMDIIEPSEEKTVGGAFTVYGTGTVSLGSPSDIDKVYIQFSTSPTFESTSCNINGKDWWKNRDGILVYDDSLGKSGPSWNFLANKDGKLDPISPTTKWELYVRVRGVNSSAGDDGKGAWSEVRKIVIDKDAPVIGNLKVQDTSGGEKNYTSNMWITDKMTLMGDITDSSGIKEIEIKYGYAESEVRNDIKSYTLGDLKGQGWVKEDTTTVTGKTNYTLKMPLSLNDITAKAKADGKFKVYIFVKEDTDQNLNNSIELTFRYDTATPNGGYGVKLADGNTSFGPTSVNDAKIAEVLGGDTQDYNGNGKILVDNVVVTPKSISVATVNFEVSGNPASASVNGQHNFIVYEPKSKIIAGSDCRLQGVANDDGSGVEKVEVWVKDNNDKESSHAFSTRYDSKNKLQSELGNQCTWNVLIDTTSLADGKGTVHYKVFDQSGNIYEDSEEVVIRNKPVQVNKIVLQTKVGGQDLIAPDANASNEDDAPDLKVTKNTTDEYSNVVKEYASTNFDFKSLTDSYIKLELSGGQGDKKYKLVYNGTELHNLRNMPTDSVIELTESDFNTIQNSNGTPKSVQVLIWDAPLGFTQGEGTPAAKVDITTLFDALDRQKPASVILPFYWNGEKQNSLFENSRKNGHIEIKEDGNSQVSGKVSLRGIAYDNINVKKLTATVDGKVVELTEIANGKNASANGLTLTVTNTDVDYMGHYVEWQLDWDTQDPSYAVGMGKTVTVIANDGRTTDGDSDENSDRPVLKAVTQDGFTAKYNSTDFPSETKPNQFVLLKKGEMQYLGRVEGVAASTHSLSIVDSSSLAGLTFDKAKVFGYTENANKISVDVVPYITEVETGLSKAYKSNPSTFNRSALGWYPVQVGESITVNGFNMTGSTVKIAGSEIAATHSAGKMVITISQGTKSGALELEVNNIKSINNTNKNPTVDGVSGTMLAAYNSEANGVNNDRLTDDRILYVWKIDRQISGSQIKYPTMRVGKDANQTVTFVYAYGSEQVKMRRTGITTPTDWILGGSFSPWNVTAVAVDDRGRVYAASENTDSGVVRTTHGYNNTSNYMFWAWMQGDGMTGSGGAYYGTTFALALESNYNGTLNNTYRISSPKIAVRTDNSGTAYVYTAYFDTSENQVKFRYGTVKGSVSSPTMTDALVSHRSTGNGSGAKFQVVAGTGAQGNDSEGNTNVDRAGDYVAVGTTSTGTAVIAWYDATNQALMYSYNDTPQLNDSPANLEKWGKNTKIIDANLAGWYVDLTVDKADGIHIAYYSMADGDLKYAYLSSINAEPQIVTVDSYLSTGTNITIDTKKKIDGGTTHYVPYISYYMTSFTRTAYAVRTAWLNSVGQPNIPRGVDGEKYTGDWEVQTVPVQNRVSDYTVGIGIKKNSSGVDSIILGYGTDKDLQSAILE